MYGCPIKFKQPLALKSQHIKLLMIIGKCLIIQNQIVSFGM